MEELGIHFLIVGSPGAPQRLFSHKHCGMWIKVTVFPLIKEDPPLTEKVPFLYMERNSKRMEKHEVVRLAEQMWSSVGKEAATFNDGAFQKLQGGNS